MGGKEKGGVIMRGMGHPGVHRLHCWWHLLGLCSVATGWAGSGADWISLAGYLSPPHNQLAYSTCSPVSYKLLESRDNVSVSVSEPPLSLAVLGWGRVNG